MEHQPLQQGMCDHQRHVTYTRRGANGGRYLKIVQVDAGRVIGPGFIRLRVPEPRPVLLAQFVGES